MLQVILLLTLICLILILAVIVCADPRISLEKKQPSLNFEGKILASSSLTKYHKKKRRSYSGKFITGIKINSLNDSKRKQSNSKKTNAISPSLFFLSPKASEKQPDSSLVQEQSSTAVKSSGSNYYAILIKQIKVKSVSQYGVQ